METSCSVLLWRPYTRLGLGEAVGDGWALEIGSVRRAAIF